MRPSIAGTGTVSCTSKWVSSSARMPPLSGLTAMCNLRHPAWPQPDDRASRKPVLSIAKSRLRPASGAPVEIQCPAAARQGRVVRYPQLEAEEREDRGDQTFRLPKRQAEDGAHGQHGGDRRVAEGAATLRLAPGRDRVGRDPDGDAATAHERPV